MSTKKLSRSAQSEYVAQAIAMHPDCHAMGVVFMQALIDEGFNPDDVHAVLNQVTAYATNPRDPVFNGMRRVTRENGLMLTGIYRPTHAQILAAGVGAVEYARTGGATRSLH